jgi:hypothetical protein
VGIWPNLLKSDIPIRFIRRPGSNAKTLGGKRKTDLTLTGLLMEGLGIQALSQNVEQYAGHQAPSRL